MTEPTSRSRGPIKTPLSNHFPRPPRSVEGWNKFTYYDFRGRLLPDYCPKTNTDYIFTVPLGFKTTKTESLEAPRPKEARSSAFTDRYLLVLEDHDTINDEDFQHCLKLVEATSAADYRASSTGWSAAKKRKEMRLLDMKYLLLKPLNDTHTTGAAKGFLSFMITSEDNREVVYIYELHLEDDLRGKGIGKWMMAQVERIGQRAGMRMAMLTVFRSNDRAVRFYKSLGYEKDEYSPAPVNLRGGRIKEPDYLILSKELGNENIMSTESRDAKQGEEEQREDED